MRPKNFFDLVCQGLPDDINPRELKAYGKPEWWEGNLRLACAYALRKCPRLNWQAYVAAYPDVRAAGIDPVLHFLNHGVYEGRRLASWNRFHAFAPKGLPPAPKVSVIVPNYNNVLFLKHCLNSLIHQTLDEIEIIVVDDASTDDSMSVINQFAAQDDRIKVIAFAENRSQHMARKAGVAAARGDYIMFLDADDSYTPNACEVAYRAIAKGYDMVSFNVNIINHVHFSHNEVYNIDKSFNGSEEGLYTRDEILQIVFVDKSINHSVWDKVYERNMLQEAFRRMEDGYLVPGEDAYEFLVIASLARNLYKIKDSLYNYAYGVGGSTFDGSNADALRGMDLGKVFEPLKKYCEIYGLQNYFIAIKNKLTGVFYIFTEISQPIVTEYMRLLVEYFGVLHTVQSFARIYAKRWDEVSLKFMHYQLKRKEHVKRIGIIFHLMSIGGVERTIQNMCRILKAHNYEIVVFLREKSDAITCLDSDVKMLYIGTPDYDTCCKQYISDFYAAIQEANIDLMFYMTLDFSYVLWDVLLLRLMGVAVIGSLRLDINEIMFYARRSYTAANCLNVWRCFDKIFCLNISTEIYFRSQGIDCQYLPNTIRCVKAGFSSHVPEPKNTIAVVGRLADGIKQTLHALMVLKEVLEHEPDVRMIFIGDFIPEERRAVFMQTVDDLGLAPHVTVTGWTDKPEYFFAQAKILFSASYLEGFPNGIAEAQACGLPVVMYDLDIELAENNESVIRVPQGDHKAAAMEIVRLLRDEEERRRLTEIARTLPEKYPDELFASNLIDLIENFDRQSPVHYYTDAEYARAIRYMAWYAGRPGPEFELPQDI